MAPAGEFLGAPDPADDIVIGLSETMLDLAGHHMVTSGAMCLGVGTGLIEQLNLGTVGLLVPSLAELGSPDGKDPLLLVLRPTTALDFTVGAGTETDPSIQIAVKSLEIEPSSLGYDAFGQLLERQGELESAMTCFRNALRMNQGQPPEPLPLETSRLSSP